MPKLPARYIGSYPVLLKEGQGRMYDGYGKPLTTNLLNHGDTLMIADTELLGQTYKRRSKGSDQVDYLGAGRIVLPEHEGLPDDELVGVHGYQFHEGRSDFVPLSLDAPDETTTPAKKKRVPDAPVEE